METSMKLEQIREKLRIIKPKPPEGGVPATKAYQTSRVTALEDGLNLNRSDGGIIKYPDISLLMAFRLDSDPDTWYIELFVYGHPLPFRLPQKAINYRQFLPEVGQRSKDNFTAFLFYLIEQVDSVYVDDHTLEFLKSGKIVSFPDFKYLEDYSRQIWFQLMSWMKFQCDKCGEVYWVDDAKVSPQGAKTKCTKCQNIIMVKQREKPEPIIVTKEKRKTVRCPHCNYENQDGAQFCVMCQEALVEIKPKSKLTIGRKTEPEQPTVSQGQTSAAADEQPATPPIDLGTLPLQAQEKRAPQLSLQELENSLQADIGTLTNKFSWYTMFARILQGISFVALLLGVIVAGAIYFVRPTEVTPETWTDPQRMRYALLTLIAGALVSLICLITGNVISLNLEIERNTRTTALLLQRLLSRLK